MSAEYKARVCNGSCAVSLSLDQKQAAAKKFAPVIYLEEDATYYPSSVPWYLNRVSLVYQPSGGDPENIYSPGEMANSADEPAGTRLVSPASHLMPQGSSPPRATAANDPYVKDWYINFEDNDPYVAFGVIYQGRDNSESSFNSTQAYDNYKSSYSSKSSESQAGREQIMADNCPFYVHFLNAGSDIDIVYWFFYPYNGAIDVPVVDVPIDAHQGDWEHAIARVSGLPGNAQLKKLYCAHHSGGAWNDPSGLTWYEENKRAYLYSSKDDHATYDDQAVGLSSIGGHHHHAQPADETNKGDVWKPNQLVLLNPDPTKETEHPWNSFLGNFGGSGHPSNPVATPSHIPAPAMRGGWILSPS